MSKTIKKIKTLVNKLLEPKIEFPLHPLPKGVKRIGSDYGAWVIPAEALTQASVCYCVGAGLDISFDIGLVQQYNCQVHVFDPTPRAITHFEQLKKHVKEGQAFHTNNQPDYFYQVNLETLETIQFHPVGLWKEDTTLKFFVPANEKHISHSAVNLQGTDKYFEAPVKKLSTLMQELGHDRLDLLKIDIEGAEYQVIDTIVEEKLEIGILCIEFDETARNNMDRKYATRIQKALDSLFEIGYRGVYIDNDFNFTLVHETRYQKWTAKG